MMKTFLKFFLVLSIILAISNKADAFDNASFTNNGKKLTPEYMAKFQAYYYDDSDNYILLNREDVKFIDGSVVFDIIMPSEYLKNTSLLVIEADLPGNRFRRYAALTYANKDYKIKKILFTQPKDEWESLANYPLIKKIAREVADTKANS